MFEETLVSKNQGAVDAVSQNLNACLLHEIRNTLGAVRLTLHQIAGGQSEDPAALAGSALKAVEHLANVINSGLDLSSLQSGKLDATATNLRALVGESLELANQGGASQKHLRISSAVAENVPQAVMVDATRLRQVLVNLLFNAVKFTPAEGAIQVEVIRTKEGIRFAVVDSGPGMTQEVSARLFQPYSQATGVNSKLGGTGLGLYISRLIVEAMGGAIGVSSTPGQGSSFYFDIECTICAAPSSESPAAVKPVVDGGGKDQSPRSVLVLEDEDTIRRLMVAMLTARGLSCRAVSRVAEALKEIGQQQFDMAFVDATLNGESGVEFVERLRAHEKAEAAADRIKIIAMSGDVELSRQQFEAAGVDGFLEKPFAPAQLFAVLAAKS